MNRLQLLCCLILTATNVSAQNETAIRDAGGIQLTGAEDPATSKVYIVQLRSPSAAEHHASLSESRTTASLSTKTAPPRFEKNSAAVQSYTARLDEEQQRVLKERIKALLKREDAVLVDSHGEPLHTIKAGDVLSIHGQTGEVFVGSRAVLSVNQGVTD